MAALYAAANDYAGMVTLIDGGTALSGSFASSNEMSTEGLVNGLLITQTLVQDGINFDLQLVTTVTTPVPMPDPEFPTGCVVMGGGLLADGGTLTCISETPITEAIATNVDGVTIIIGESATQTTVMPASGDALSATIASTSAAGNITINSEFGTISGGANGIVASTAGSGSISITSAAVTGNANRGIDAGLSNSGATGDLSITASGAVTGGSDGIYALNAGTGTTSITVASVSATSGVGILTRTRAGASITVNAGGTVSGGGGMNAIETQAPSGDSSSTPSDTVTVMGTVTGGNILTLTGADTVTLAATSTTTGITIDLGEGDDRLDLASTAFGTLDGGADADTLSISGTGITLDGGAHSGFETLTFAAGSNTLSGAHVGLTATNFNAGTTILTGSLASTTAAVASGAALDLAAGSSLAGDLTNSGMLTVAGTGFGSATITGDLTLGAGGTLTLDTAGMGNANDLLMVSGAVTLGGTLALRQTTMPAGTVTLIDGGTALSGNFASSNEMSTEGLVNGLLISQTLVMMGSTLICNSSRP